MGKYVKVMFGTTSGADKNLEYKIGEVNVANNWNPTAIKGGHFGDFNFSTEDKLNWKLNYIFVTEDIKVINTKTIIPSIAITCQSY